MRRAAWFVMLTRMHGRKMKRIACLVAAALGASSAGALAWAVLPASAANLPLTGLAYHPQGGTISWSGVTMGAVDVHGPLNTGGGGPPVAHCDANHAAPCTASSIYVGVLSPGAYNVTIYGTNGIDSYSGNVTVTTGPPTTQGPPPTQPPPTTQHTTTTTVHTPPPPPNPNRGTILDTGQALKGGQYLQSRNGLYKLVMQYDGNLVEYGPSGAMWATCTYGSGYLFRVQTNGKAAVHRPDGVAVWSTPTLNSGSSNYFILQDDGNMLLNRVGGRTVWSSFRSPHMC